MSRKKRQKKVNKFYEDLESPLRDSTATQAM